MCNFTCFEVLKYLKELCSPVISYFLFAKSVLVSIALYSQLASDDLYQGEE